MTRNPDEVAILLADITGSTPLYQKAGDEAAARQVSDCLDHLRSAAEREGGIFVRSKGDDLLCTFADPAAALRAARLMLFQLSSGPLAIHAGIHFGQTIPVGGDVYGDAVNLTARLAASAKPGEILASRRFLDQLSEPEVCAFRPLDSMTFKGRHAATEVYSFLEDVQAARTEMFLGSGSGNPRAGQDIVVLLSYGTGSWQYRDRDILSIGRSPDCGLVIRQPWISRRHATLTVRGGKIQLDDQSSSGTYVTMQEQETFLHRETALLTGTGTISPARRPADSGAEIIHYRIMRSQ